MKLRKMALCALAILMLHSASAQAETIYLSVAASMTDAVNQIIGNFTAQNPGVKVLPNYGASGALAKQIEQGAPADLFVSADTKWMKYLLEKNLIASGTDRIFVYNKLVFVGQPGSKVSELSQIPTLGKIAIGMPESVPAGQYAKKAMESANIYTTLAQEKKLVMAKDVRQALLYADRGEVDGAFVYKTDALLATKAKILFTVPDKMYPQVVYPLGLTTAGAKKPEAVAFQKYLATSESIKILTDFGFEPAK